MNIRSNWNKNSGFSLIELLIVLAIMLIILGIVVNSYNSAKSRKQVEITADSIGARLEEAKTNAISGKNGKSYGLQFSSTTYTLFSGNAYNPSDTTNSSSTVPNNIQLTRTLQGSDTVIFTKISGIPQVTGTIKISDMNNASNTISITIGSYGEINVLK